MPTKRAGYAPPSAVVRALLSLVLLLGFYLLLLGLAALFFVIPIALVKLMHRIGWYTAVLFLFCWTPAVLLVKSAFSTRREEFVPPPRRLAPNEAPRLFAMIDELARDAGTVPPGEVYLDPFPNLSVTEVGRAFSTRRVMIVGAPLFELLSVDELRAGIAHELGHFIGGDTRLTTFTVQTHALFGSVLTTTELDPFRAGTRHYAVEAGLVFAQALGHGLVAAYGRLFLRITRPLSRRQELAADALSAALVGSAATASALERIATASPLYSLYLTQEVGHAVKRGAMPTDLLPGFHRMREQVLSRDEGRKFVEALKAEATDPYDTHPALPDRLRALAGIPSGGAGNDERPASVLLADSSAIDAWLVQATRERVIAAVIAGEGAIGTVRDLPWAKIPAEAYAPAAREAARKLASELHSRFPGATTLGGMFAAVSRRVAEGKTLDLAAHLEPAVRGLPEAHAEGVALEVCSVALGTLMQGALLERGAVVEESLGSPSLVLRLDDERIDPLEMLRLLATNPEAGRAALGSWAERLERG
jgi:Zn-dependent protease with chaperone function